jgi:hypothetical protein
MVIRRPRRLNVLISDEEWAMLQYLADKAGITASDWIRMRIREAVEAEPPPKPLKTKRK